MLYPMKELAPIAPEEKKHCAELHRVEYPDRDDTSQRRQYNKLVKKSKNFPTGDPNMPEDLDLARQVNRAIAERCNLGQDDSSSGEEMPPLGSNNDQDEDDDDDDDGDDDGLGVPRASPRPAGQRAGTRAGSRAAGTATSGATSTETVPTAAGAAAVGATAADEDGRATAVAGRSSTSTSSASAGRSSGASSRPSSASSVGRASIRPSAAIPKARPTKMAKTLKHAPSSVLTSTPLVSRRSSSLGRGGSPSYDEPSFAEYMQYQQEQRAAEREERAAQRERERREDRALQQQNQQMMMMMMMHAFGGGNRMNPPPTSMHPSMMGMHGPFRGGRQDDVEDGSAGSPSPETANRRGNLKDDRDYK